MASSPQPAHLDIHIPTRRHQPQPPEVPSASRVHDATRPSTAAAAAAAASSRSQSVRNARRTSARIGGVRFGTTTRAGLGVTGVSRRLLDAFATSSGRNRTDPPNRTTGNRPDRANEYTCDNEHDHRAATSPAVNNRSGSLDPLTTPPAHAAQRAARAAGRDRATERGLRPCSRGRLRAATHGPHRPARATGPGGPAPSSRRHAPGPSLRVEELADRSVDVAYRDRDLLSAFSV